MRKTPMGTCQQPCSVVRDPSGTPFVVSKNNTCKRSFGGITIKIHYKIKYLKVPTYEWCLQVPFIGGQEAGRSLADPEVNQHGHGADGSLARHRAPARAIGSRGVGQHCE